MVFVICRSFKPTMRSYIFLIFTLFSLQVLSQDSQNEKVDFKTISADVTVIPKEQKVTGTVEYQFQILKETDSIYIDARNLDIKKLQVNGEVADFNNTGSRLWVKKKFLPSEENKIILEYSATPKQAMYFINWNSPDSVNAVKQVWTQGQGKNTSHWLPSFDDLAEKATFSMKISFPEDYKVIANGELKSKTAINDSLVQWHYSMEKPMSSYLVAVAAGNFDEEEITSTSGVPLFNYYEPNDKEKSEPTFRYSAEIFDFLEKETGVAYPWQNYKQVPVRDFLYSGMENTGATIFSRALVVDSVAYNDQNYVMVNAHELAHQWFGDYVTAANGDHHWLHEGFATFFALLAEKELFGEDYYYWKLFQSAEELKALSDQGKGEALINAKASSLTYYQKGAWALHILRERVGAEAFKKAVKNYLQKYAYVNATTDDFLAEVEAASGKNMEEFKADWLTQSAFQGSNALSSLKNSEFIKRYMEMVALREVPYQNKKELLLQGLQFPINDYIGQEVVYQLADVDIAEALPLYRKAMESGNLYVRQAIAVSRKDVPEALKSSFEELLKDDSYLTIENALMNLFLNYPEEAEKWLAETKGIKGFSNLNVRMLWLVINLVSPQVAPEKTNEYFEELSGYTSPHYPFEVRQNAFGYLYQINAFTTQNLKDLLQASQHHNSRFRDFSRKLLETLLQNPDYREKYIDLKSEISDKDREFLNSRVPGQ